MILVLLSVLTVSLGITGWYTLQEQAKEITRQTRQHGDSLARYTSKSMVYSVVGYDYHTIQLLLDEIVKAQDIVYAKVVNAKGHVMAEAGNFNAKAEPWTIFRHDIVFDKAVVGGLTLMLDNHQIVEQLRKQRNTLIKREGIIILLIAIGEFLALSYVIIRPVSIITGAMESNVDDDGLITTDIPFDSSDEFGQLAQQFNEMRGRLNVVTEKLHSRINLADQELLNINGRLLEQSEELQRMNKELQFLSITDPLTNLYNRRHFSNLLEKEFAFSKRHNQSLSLICFDIDHFKNVNDTYGHAAGDIVLSEIATMLKNKIRSTDVACRIGGEEFAIICRHTSKEGIEELAEKLRLQIEQHRINIGSEVISVSASFGLNTYPDSYVQISSHEELVNCADMAMYYSKEHGRNRITHYAEILNSIEKLSNNIQKDEEQT